jgi:hypothetical protein
MDSNQTNDMSNVDALLSTAKDRLNTHAMRTASADQVLARLQAQLQINEQNKHHQEALVSELAFTGPSSSRTPFAAFHSSLLMLGVIVLAIALTILGWRALRGTDASAPTSFAANAPAAKSPTAAVAPGSDLDSSPFFALVSDQELNAYQERARVVSTQVPNVLLASYGVPTPPQYADSDVRVDWLVSSSGRKLAVRLVE